MTEHQPPTYKLFCLVYGEDSFEVEIAANKSVSVLKDAIKEKKANTLANIDANNLTLYLINLPDDDNVLKQKADQLFNPEVEPAFKRLKPSRDLSDIFQGTPTKNTVHILVQSPNDVTRSVVQSPPAQTHTNIRRGRSEEEVLDNLMPSSKKQKIEVNNITHQLVAKWSQPIPATSLQTLRTYLQLPLAEEEKIPISQSQFDDLCVPYSIWTPTLSLRAEKLSTLFRVSADERIDTLPMFTSAILLPPPTNGIEEVFHQFWDCNISVILRLILSESDIMFIRNSNHKTSTALKRPDYGFLIKNNCVLRGEEKGSDSAGNPEQELVEKLKWTYNPLPYILGYHAVTTDVRYVAITSPPSETKPLFGHNLNFKEERVANMVHLIRLSGVIAWLGQQLPYRGRPEFVPFELQDGDVQMSIGATVVRKKFRHKDAVDRVLHLVEIYKLLERKQVPNVDTLQRFKIEGGYPHVYLSPVGIDRLPESGLEAFNAVVCVLRALTVMHSSPHPVYHRDIRYPNIIKKYDGQGWFLIDWSDASTAPTCAVTHLEESEHSPRVRQDNHGAEVDIWGIGKYMEYLAGRAICKIASPAAVKQMARRWIADHTTSAAIALEEAARDLFIGPSV